MKPSKCYGCPLYQAPGPCEGEGPQDARIMLVGEAPGSEEVSRRPYRPFVGPAGRVLSLAMRAAGVDRRTCYVTNIVKCFPRGTPTQATVEFCRAAWLDSEITEVKPNVVVAVGAVAFRGLMRDEQHRPISEWRGYVLAAPDPGAVDGETTDCVSAG